MDGRPYQKKYWAKVTKEKQRTAYMRFAATCMREEKSAFEMLSANIGQTACRS